MPPQAPSSSSSCSSTTATRHCEKESSSSSRLNIVLAVCAGAALVTLSSCWMLRRILLCKRKSQNAAAAAAARRFASSSTIIDNASQCCKNKIFEGKNVIEKKLAPEIMEAHDEAVAAEYDTYIDPNTDLIAFTRLGHIRRGRCCGGGCRHCPYGHVNAPDSVKAVLGISIADESGDTTASTTTTTAAATQPPDAKAKAAATVVAAAAAAATPPAGGRCCDVNKSNVYTRTGDEGTSAIFTGERRSKVDLIFEALGSVDELNCGIGLAKEHCKLALLLLLSEQECRGGVAAAAAAVNKDKSVRIQQVVDVLDEVQHRLLDVGSIIATPSTTTAPQHQRYDPARWTNYVERSIDTIDAQLPPLTSFIVPGGCVASAQLHVSRTVCRRAERAMVRVREQEPREAYGETFLAATKFVNRLSDFLFVAARAVSENADTLRGQQK